MNNTGGYMKTWNNSSGPPMHPEPQTPPRNTGWVSTGRLTGGWGERTRRRTENDDEVLLDNLIDEFERLRNMYGKVMLGKFSGNTENVEIYIHQLEKYTIKVTGLLPKVEDDDIKRAMRALLTEAYTLMNSIHADR
jgi:hypothetical protein